MADREAGTAVPSRNGSQEAYELLQAAIVDGKLQPNERLVESDLIRMLPASRSAVRTALVRLTQEGLVEHEPNRGAKVRLIDEHEAAEILESRMVLEGLAARYAARHATKADVTELRAILEEMRGLLDARRSPRGFRPQRKAARAPARDRPARNRLAARRGVELAARPVPVPDDPRARTRGAVPRGAPRDRGGRRRRRPGRRGAGRPDPSRPCRRGAARPAPADGVGRLAVDPSRRIARMSETIIGSRVARGVR